MTSHSDGVATDNTRAAVAVTVATVGGGVDNGASVTVATVGDSIGDGAVAAADDTVIDGTVTDTGTVKKRNFHTGLDPVSRTKNSAQPTEFNAGGDTVDKVRYAQSFSLDTGSSPVWSVVADAAATDSDRVTVVGTVATSATASATVPLLPSSPSATASATVRSSPAPSPPSASTRR